MITFIALLLAASALVRAAVVRTPMQPRAPWLAVAVVCVVVAVMFAGPLMVFEKAVGRALLPMGLVWTASWLVVVWRLGAGERVRAALAVAVTVTVVGSEPLGHVMMRALEKNTLAVDPFDAGTFDAVIVLGGGVESQPHPHFGVGAGGDRVFLGARLWHRQQTPLLIATGSAIESFRDTLDSTVATPVLWRDVGVAADAIITVHDTRNTREEARECAKLIRQRGFRRVGLVTSAYHMPRALRLFAREGVTVVPLPANSHASVTWDGVFSLVAVGEGAWLQQKAAWELLGMMMGR